MWVAESRKVLLYLLYAIPLCAVSYLIVDRNHIFMRFYISRTAEP